MAGKQSSTLQRERNVLELLQKRACTIDTVSETLGIQYYTARRIVSHLMETGHLKVVDTVNRQRVYAYNTDGIHNADFIPRLTHLLNRSQTKAIFLVEGTGDEDNMKSTLAAKALPKHMVELMDLAMSGANGVDITFRLNMLRDQMQKDFLYLKNAAYLYEQILQEPKFWERTFLQEMVDDDDYNYTTIQKAKAYYDSL